MERKIQERFFGLGFWSRVLLGTALVCAVSFILLHGMYQKFPGSFILKAFPAVFLSMLMFRHVKTPQGWLVGIGLLFSAGGDVALDYDRINLFLMGLVLFLIAHVFYIIAFSRSMELSLKRWFPRLVVVLSALILAWVLRDIRPDRLVPVMVYLAVIAFMAFMAFSMKPFRLLVAAGAVLFMVSDTIIAVNQFLYPLPHSTVYNISIYYTAQFLISLGFILYTDLDA